MQAYRDDRGNNILHLAAVHGATFVMRTPTFGCARVSDRVLTESKGCNSWNCFNKTMEHWKIICKRHGLEPSVTTTYLVGKCLHLNLNTCVEKAGGRQEITTMLLEEFGGCPKHSAKPETTWPVGSDSRAPCAQALESILEIQRVGPPLPSLLFTVTKRFARLGADCWNMLKASFVYRTIAKAWRTSPTGVDDKEGRPKHRECIQADRQSFCAKMISLLASKEGCICHRQRRRDSRGAKRQGFPKGSPGML